MAGSHLARRGAPNQVFALRRGQLACERRPALQHSWVPPSVFDRPACLLRLEQAAGLQRARQQRHEKSLERTLQRDARQQVLKASDALAPARLQPLPAHERLRRLRRVEQAQPVRRQRELTRVVVRQQRDEAAQCGDALPLRRAQTGHAGGTRIAIWAR